MGFFDDAFEILKNIEETLEWRCQKAALTPLLIVDSRSRGGDKVRGKKRHG